MNEQACDYCPKPWTVQVWRVNMHSREWLCEEHYAERSEMYTYQIEVDCENDRIRAEAYAAAAQADPQETQRLVELGMEIVRRILAEREGDA